MTTVNPYLTLNGNCEEAFNFYKSVFGGDFQFIGRYKDIPANDRKNFTKETDQMIMHVSLPISRETILMGCDSAGVSSVVVGNIALSVTTDSKAEADRIFNGLSAGGQTKMAMAETFWGSYFGMCTDKFGVQWTISYDAKGG
jgi:PhnB protein